MTCTASAIVTLADVIAAWASTSYAWVADDLTRHAARDTDDADAFLRGVVIGHLPTAEVCPDAAFVLELAQAVALSQRYLGAEVADAPVTTTARPAVAPRSAVARARTSAFARRVGLYELAVLDADTLVGPHPDLVAGAVFEYRMDHLEVADRVEAACVRRVLTTVGCL